MIKFFTQSKWALVAYAFFFSFHSFTQAIIKVTVTSVQVNNDEDCDGWPFGDSDFVWEYTGTDNTLGYTNNNPALFGVFDFNYTNIDNNNGPYNNNVNSTFFLIVSTYVLMTFQRKSTWLGKPMKTMMPVLMTSLV
jgi:hypothetical protein